MKSKSKSKNRAIAIPFWIASVGCVIILVVTLILRDGVSIRTSELFLLISSLTLMAVISLYGLICWLWFVSFTLSHSNLNQKRCARCGKKIKKGHGYKMTDFDPIHGTEVCHWCEKCHDDFINEIANSPAAFTDVKPAASFAETKKEIEKWFENRRIQNNSSDDV